MEGTLQLNDVLIDILRELEHSNHHRVFVCDNIMYVPSTKVRYNECLDSLRPDEIKSEPSLARPRPTRGVERLMMGRFGDHTQGLGLTELYETHYKYTMNYRSFETMYYSGKDRAWHPMIALALASILQVKKLVYGEAKATGVWLLDGHIQRNRLTNWITEADGDGNERITTSNPLWIGVSFHDGTIAVIDFSYKQYAFISEDQVDQVPTSRTISPLEDDPMLTNTAQTGEYTMECMSLKSVRLVDRPREPDEYEKLNEDDEDDDEEEKTVIDVAGDLNMGTFTNMRKVTPAMLKAFREHADDCNNEDDKSVMTHVEKFVKRVCDKYDIQVKK
jgi:hypothetical protein